MITIISYIMYSDRKKAYDRHLPVYVTGGYLTPLFAKVYLMVQQEWGCRKRPYWKHSKEDSGILS